MSQLFYKEPSGWDWEKALPIGNGKLGAMIYGESTMEHYQLNEDSVWFGGPMERVNPDAKANLEKVRKLIFNGEIPEAERLLKYAFTGTPQGERVYQTMGDFFVDFMDTVTEPLDFERRLDLETAIHKVKVTDGKSGVTFYREAFAAASENVIVTRLTASETKKICAAATINRMSFYDKTWHTKDSVFFSGNLGEGGVDLCVGMTMVSGEEVEVLGEHILTKEADEVTIFLTAATSFRHENPKKEVENVLRKVREISYDKLKKNHVNEYRNYFSTCRLSLEKEDAKEEMPTNERLEAEEPDNGLMETYFDFGRYLMISCSRPGSLPANLQGIWNDSINPPWGSKYTININTQMNYWPVEMLGLSKCHLPLFELLKRMAKNGEKTAREMYGCRGFVAHHNTDIWADSAPQDMYNPATYWVMGGAWLCTHIWEHYLFTKDFDFLKEMYPVMKSACLFFVDFLVKKDGYYVTCPSVSPENTYILSDGTRGCNGYGVTMDNEILHDLFTQYLQAAELLKEADKEFVEDVKERLKGLPPIRIGSEGQILEWIEEYGEAEPGHRHISHLYALHPSSQIMVDQTPELAEGARTTLKRRLANGGGHTGWSRAWIINMYARLWESEKAYENLVALLKKSTLPNLFDFHPPFQIDGNFGAIAAMGEIILQSNGGRTVLLPALPKAWKNGSIHGVYGRGGIRYDLVWENGRLTELKATAEAEDIIVDVIWNEENHQLTLARGETYHWCLTK